METIRIISSEGSHPEMLQRTRLHETFFSLKNVPQRPVSVATEFMESDCEYDGMDDEIVSEPDEVELSPRESMHSSGQPSITTLSSYEEAHTPRSSQNVPIFAFGIEALKQVEGPHGPHLFRSSMVSAHSIEFQNALSLSPITPKVDSNEHFQLPIALDLAIPEVIGFTQELLDTEDLVDWPPSKVAQWMLNAGVEVEAAKRFLENDITGAVLCTLRFEDLKELGIPSFGVRTRIWEEIHVMRNIRPTSPDPETPIEDAPSREVRREQRKQDGENGVKRKASKKRAKPSGPLEDIISPLESVSIVGIEQMMPKPHHCSKGEKCSKWKRQQRMIQAFKKDHPYFNMDDGVLMVAGDPGNPQTAAAIKPTDDMFRPVSDAIPSVVASSDVMGLDGLPPLQYLQEAALRNLQSRDPQDNVRHFLDFQATHSDEVPPTPPFEIIPQHQTKRHSLRALPKLSIPVEDVRSIPKAASAHPLSRQLVEDNGSPEEAMEYNAPYRFGTPFSEMDVPITTIPMAPIPRDASQSVPPDMNYRMPQISRSASRASRRPSFPMVLAPLDENNVTEVPASSRSPPRANRAQRPLQAPPRVQYPWTQANRTYERTLAPIPGSAANTPTAISRASPLNSNPTGITSTSATATAAVNPVQYEGPMRKRKTKMLRHEWSEHYFTLRGTRLAMHRDAAQKHRTLEYIDIDDYAIACSSLASTSKFNAAFKAMSILRGSDKDAAKKDAGAFAFQLIPQDGKGTGLKLRKRESTASSLASGSSSIKSAATGSTATSSNAPPPPSEGANTTGKTHHFAVKNRDERIDWMRELMLAKALKQKGEGFEVSVNGNMI